MEQSITIHSLLEQQTPLQFVLVRGWVRTRRDAKGFSFLEINDGSTLRNFQLIVDASVPGASEASTVTTGASISARGALVESPAKGQKWEMRVESFELLGESPPDYPLQKKGHSLEFLREIAHLRPRTNLFGCLFRLRSRMTLAVHQYYQTRRFHLVHTPVITASDCEGAGEMFRVTTQKRDEKQVASADFFARDAYLTVSGQLEGEIFACALGRIYTFGPTFRAENSNTARHAAEFWMIEPEVAFFDLENDMNLAEDFLQSLVRHALEHCREELDFFSQFIDKELYARLRAVADTPFIRITYTEAVEMLLSSGKAFENPVAWGVNLQSEHERWLTEERFQKPVIVRDYPTGLKPFYMRQNDDGKTVAAMDVLVPRIGEIMGGSQREERLNLLLQAMRNHGLSAENYGWYADLRKYGSVPHAGFGMGFERLLMFLSGVGNIRDVIPFARTPGHVEF